ncbi:hypothetical protein PLICRDRAFT_332337 [Plicaturopsis crispa FD-325 SS-3]|uniref:F-box domain-containing protein n=1 Tax=Plicaturopsis crispa FD-325 SS-3 TaxID=944288 RepID=A0A0C9SLA0_PLICR|nr:hypothetical protein PLICRDRAFT_332337 [Plicaturopsis crispa FD-325 SS-3]
MQDLPLEMISRIFIHCLPPETYVRPSQNAAPLLLTQICRSWRRVAISTPQLWRSLDIHVFREEERPILDMFHAWVARSGQLPLSLSFSQTLEAGQPLRDALNAAFVDLMHRWRDITFTAGGRASLNSERVLGEAPLLREFVIKLPSDDPVYLPFSSAPNLQRFTWIGPGNYTIFQGLPLANLTKVTFFPSISMDEAISLVRACIVLEECVLGEMDTRNCAPLRTPLTHPALRLLYITTEGLVDPFLDSLVLPALESFSVRHHRPPPTVRWSSRSLEDLYDRSKFALRSLDLVSTNVGEMDLVRCLMAQHDSLNSLSIDTYPFVASVGEHLLRQLTHPDALCPRLESIMFSYCVDHSVALEIMMGMVRSRVSAYLEGCADAAHLQEVRISVPAELYDEYMSASVSLCEESLPQGAPLTMHLTAESDSLI